MYKNIIISSCFTVLKHEDFSIAFFSLPGNWCVPPWPGRVGQRLPARQATTPCGPCGACGACRACGACGAQRVGCGVGCTTRPVMNG